MKPFRTRAVELALLLAAVAAPALSPPAGALLLLGLTAAWLAFRPPRREVAVVATAFAVAAAALLVGGWAADRSDPRDPTWRRRAERGYAALWGELVATAERARSVVPIPLGEPTGFADRLAAFGALASVTGGSAEAGPALLLIDPDGLPVAWSGEGLLHELPPEEVPRAGSAYVASFGAVTLFSVVPLDDARRPWRVVAAESLTTDRFPFGATGSPPPRALRWSLVARPSEAAVDAVVLSPAAPGGDPAAAPPILVVEPEPVAAAPDRTPWRAAAWVAIGLGLLALVVMRGVGLALPPSDDTSPLRWPRRLGAPALAALAVGGGVSWGLAAGAPATALAALAAGVGLTALGLAAAPGGAAVRGLAGRAAGAVGGAAAVGALALGSWGLLGQLGPIDLASGLVGDGRGLVLRGALATAAFGLLTLAGRVAARLGGGGRGQPEQRWAWIAVALLLAAGALHDQPERALPLLLLGGGASALWAAGPGARRGIARIAVLVLLAALTAAVAWESAFRVRLRADLSGPLLTAMAPVGGDELAELEARTSRFFASRDLARLTPRTPVGLEQQDLAFVLWRGSPLARANALSTVVVEPVDADPSTFSFGLPLSADRRVDWSAPRAQEILALTQPGAILQGEQALTFRGQRWATVRYWLVPWSGFRLAVKPDLGEIEVGLLRGGPALGRQIEGLPEPALFGLYDPSGQALLSPWEEKPPLPEELVREGGRTVAAVVATPDGRAWAFARSSAAGWEVLYLPRLTPARALERIGTQALAVMLFAGLALLLALLLALPRAAFRDLLARAYRSYSKRLLIVYTVLLLLPLLLLNALLVAAMEKRLSREQRSAGEAALASAERLVGDYLVGLQPGFGVNTELNDELLSQLSRAVRHEINLYWGSALYRSSKPELFAAGLLPKRIPGDIYSRLAFRGYDLASRTNRAGRVSYLELYSPLRLPGEPGGPGRFFLSMPLLAQQEEVAQELANLRRQALLMTAALFALLVAVGARLARNFTAPLAELVEGTRRIAAGAPALGLAPTELELAALVEAVDEMARRIAEGREKLVREKQVVERMVENITSGVISLDREGRVLMHNRVAAELLHVGFGDDLAATLSISERLAPVADFVVAATAAGTGSGPAQSTVRLRGAGSEEREWNLVWVPVPGLGEPAALLVVEDATENLRSQRLQAWAEMARIIAHEIKNPLTPIRLNVEHMRQVWRDRGDHFAEVFERCTANVLAQVEELRQIASEFSAYSSLHRLDPREGDLVAAMRRLVEPYRTAPPPGIEVALTADPPSLPARFDAKLLGRAVRNLVENALRATAERGGRVEVRIERLPAEGGDGSELGAARISVLDSGPGVEAGQLGRIFDPYFSTHDAGTGLGLPIARRIVEEHGGSIAARNRSGGGLEVAITIPL